MLQQFRENKPVLIFSLAWLILNLVQSFFTEIMEDEAYYWLYSEFLDWGYFDHPPMVAVLIKLGYSIIPNALGARLFPSILGAGTIYIIWLLLPAQARNLKLFFWIVSAMSLMHLNVAGFIALPDIPLVFFTALFFLGLKYYLEEDKWQQAVFLGIVAALMMYSKYHAALIIFFTILSAWKLLFRRSFWLVTGIAVLLYLPHIIWQFSHDFASFEYHLVSRNDPFQPRQILEYIGNQLLVTGPFVGVLLLFLAFTRKVRDQFERMLKFNLIGFFGFFLLSSVRGHVEPHWTAAAFPPLIILAMTRLEGFPGRKKWVRGLAIASIPAILAIRLYLVWNFLPLPEHVTRMFHDKDRWSAEIENVAGERPVIFMNKYQHPSVYWFYTGKTAFTRNNILYRRNQFDLWPLEDQLEGQEVILTRWGVQDSTLVLPAIYGDIPYYPIKRYCSFNRIKISILGKVREMPAGTEFSLPVRFSNPTGKAVNLDCDCDLPPILKYSFINREKRTIILPVEPQPDIGIINPGDEIYLDLNFTAPTKPDVYKMYVSFGSDILIPGINGAPIEVKIAPLQESGLAVVSED
jgi:hypothetical protein